MKTCTICGSPAINPGHHGRPSDGDGKNDDLCDVCFWRGQAEYWKKQAEFWKDRNKIIAYFSDIKRQEQKDAEKKRGI